MIIKKSVWPSGAGASWSAAVPAAFRSQIDGRKKGNMDGQDGQDAKSEYRMSNKECRNLK
jgi:hypothetical protein